MQITDVTIRPSNEDLVRAYVDIVFDNCFKVEEIKVIQGPAGLFVSFPAKKQRDGSHRQLASPADAKTRMMNIAPALQTAVQQLAGEIEHSHGDRSPAQHTDEIGVKKS